MRATKTAGTKTPATAQAVPLPVPSAPRIRLSRAVKKAPASFPADKAKPEIPKKPNGAMPKRAKSRTVRCKLPGTEYGQLTLIKERMEIAGFSVKRGQLLRAGLVLLLALDGRQLHDAIVKVVDGKDKPSPGNHS
jgi:hypothetical protein